MANPQHVSIFHSGLANWNAWRAAEPDIRPDLSGADLRGADMNHWANFRFSDLRQTNFSQGRFTYADFRDTNACGADFTNASLRKARWQRADARGAIFVNANFHRGFMSRGNFQGADFTGASLDVRTAADADFTGARLVAFRFEQAPYAWDWEVSPIELGNAIGLTKVTSESQQDVLGYLHAARDYARRADLAEYGHPPDLAESLARVESYLAEYALFQAPQEMPTEILTVNRDLISYFKANPTALAHAQWRDFEQLIADLLAANGWEVQMTGRTRDGGYDVFGIHRDRLGISHTWIVECKRWDATRPVGIDVVRSLYAVKAEMRVGGALLATTSHFTKGVKEFKSSRYDLELKDREAICEWLEHHRCRHS